MTLAPALLLSLALAATGAPRAPALQGPARVAGDGRTPVVLVLERAHPQAVLEASAGTLGAQERTPDGALRVTWTPPHVAAPLDARLTATRPARRRGGPRPTDARLTVRVEVPPVLAPPHAGPLAVRAGHLRAGGEPVELALPEDPDVLSLRVSAGSAEPAGVGTAARYTPPRQPWPQPVIAAVVARDGTLRGWAVLPVAGLGEVEVATEPDAWVSFRVGGAEYGPLRTGRTGRTRMTIAAPPGQTHATAVVRDRVGNVRETRISLGVPDVRPLLLLCDGASPEVQVLAVGADGLPARGAQLRVEAPGGAAHGPLRELEPGRYAAALPPGGGEVRVAWADGHAGVPATCQRLATPVALALPPPPPQAPVPAPVAAPRAGLGLGLTPRLGWAVTGGRLAAPAALLTLGWRPAARPWLELGAEGGLVLGRQDFVDAATGDAVRVTEWVVPALVRASARPWAPLGPLQLTPFAGPRAGVLWAGGRAQAARAGSVGHSEVLPALGLHLGVDGRAGPGKLVLEAGALHGFARGGRAPLQALVVTGGYGLEL